MRTSFRQWLPDLAAWRRLLAPLAGWRWALQRHGMPDFPLEDEAPLRAELFSAEQMAQYGRQLAATHQLAAVHTPDPLLARLAANEETLLEVCKLLTITVSARHRISPAAEWLLDNFYLIEEQIRTARRHLPKGYSRELPCRAWPPPATPPPTVIPASTTSRWKSSPIATAASMATACAALSPPTRA
ncbi:hypothetical protein [Vogesella indigofera]|uniref:hypothetical protein n=1 Tax=Vogesella indigofera TaxID=45465 RepID=UPI00234E2192|nr:hypothetical protein [Vogesella indigofera]MDC7704226.1 hypothetical protein [Vogesella indigofera]